MSSLLDVLHKRPPRTQPAVDAAGATAVDLRLAAEAEAEAEASAFADTGSLPLASGEEATVEMPPPARPPEAGATTQMRRWTDPASPPADTLATAAASAPATGAKPASPWVARAPFALAMLVLLVAAVGVATWMVRTPAEEGFLADAATVAPVPPPAPPVEAAEPEPVAPAPVKPKKARRVAPAEVAPEEPEADVAGEIPWYDQPALAEPAPAPAPLITITRGTTTEDPLIVRLREAWEALRAGDAARAEALYREVLVAEPASENALLGLATLAARGGRADEARDLYRSVLQLDPRNATATAGLTALAGGEAQGGGEARLKGMLREQPASAPLHFALGLHHVAGQRWPDAQAAFFEAVRHDPTNADYAFNLAVSLDRLGQPGPAASYYQRALDLAAGSQQFDLAAARARLAALRGAGI